MLELIQRWQTVAFVLLKDLKSKDQISLVDDLGSVNLDMRCTTAQNQDGSTNKTHGAHYYTFPFSVLLGKSLYLALISELA